MGEIVKALDENGLTENTIVIFSSDNGPTEHTDSYGNGMEPAPRNLPKHDASGIWRGGKYEIFEGGTRVPLIICWPAMIKPASTNAMVNQIDFTASFAALLGVELASDQAGDSRNMIDAFLGNDAQGLPFLIEESHGLAIRVGEWKYIPKGLPGASKNCVVPEDSLFNLKDDTGEQKNVFSNYPEKAKELKELLQKTRSGSGTRTTE